MPLWERSQRTWAGAAARGWRQCTGAEQRGGGASAPGREQRGGVGEHQDEEQWTVGVLVFIWFLALSSQLATNSWFKQVGFCALHSSHQLNLADGFSAPGRL